MDSILKKLILALLLLVYIPARATVAFVQSAHQTGTTTSLTVTFGSTPSNGNVLVCGGTNGNNAVSSVTGGGGGTWTQQASSGTHVAVSIWTSQAVSGGSTTVTVTFSTSGTAGAAICAEYSGVTTTADGTNTSTGSSGSPVTGSVTTTANGDLVVGIAMLNTGGVGFSSGPTNSYTEREGSTGVITGSTVMGYADLIQSASGSTSTGWTGISGGWDGAIATLKASAVVATRRLTLLGVGP